MCRSNNAPPDCAPTGKCFAPQVGGSATRRNLALKTLPYVWLTTAFFNHAHSGQKRRHIAGIANVRAFRAAVAISAAIFVVRANGFSQITCFPARKAEITCSEWHIVGEQT